MYQYCTDRLPITYLVTHQFKQNILEIFYLVAILGAWCQADVPPGPWFAGLHDINRPHIPTKRQRQYIRGKLWIKVIMHTHLTIAAFFPEQRERYSTQQFSRSDDWPLHSCCDVIRGAVHVYHRGQRWFFSESLALLHKQCFLTYSVRFSFHVQYFLDTFSKILIGKYNQNTNQYFLDIFSIFLTCSVFSLHEQC